MTKNKDEPYESTDLFKFLEINVYVFLKTHYWEKKKKKIEIFLFVLCHSPSYNL